MAYDATVPWEGACAGGRCVMWGPRCGLECVWAGEDTMSHVPATWDGGHLWERQREARSRWRHQPGQHTVMGRHQRTPTATKQHPQNSSSCPDPRGPPGPAPSVPHVPPMPRARISHKDGESCTKPHTFCSKEVCFPPCWLHVTVFLSRVRRSSNWICLRAMPGWAR